MSNRKTYDELKFTDDFLFCRILSSNLELCKKLLEIILNKQIKSVALATAQKSEQMLVDGKGIRLDVYVEGENEVYNIEMQTSNNPNLAKRARYYQGMNDVYMLQRAANYKQLKPTYIIFICMFDMFDRGLPIYTFSNKCLECPGLELGDEAYKIFVNPFGRTDGMTDALKKFLNFLINGEAEDSFTKDLKENVEKAKCSEEWRSEFMTLAMKLDEEREVGRAEGRAEGLAEGRAEGKAKERKRIFAALLQRMSEEEAARISMLSPEERMEVKRELGID